MGLGVPRPRRLASAEGPVGGGGEVLADVGAGVGGLCAEQLDPEAVTDQQAQVAQLEVRPGYGGHPRLRSPADRPPGAAPVPPPLL